jgi:hypothetical protein
MFKLEHRLQPAYKMLLLETNRIYSVKFFLFAGVAGTVLHVLFDATLYSDIRPFFPSSANPLLYTSVLSGIDAYTLSLWMGIFGIAFYAVLAIFHLHKTTTFKKTALTSRLQRPVTINFGKFRLCRGKHINQNVCTMQERVKRQA